MRLIAAATRVRPQPASPTPEALRKPSNSPNDCEVCSDIFLCPPVCKVEIEIGQYDHGKEQDVRERCRLACLHILECDTVDIDRDRFGRCPRPTLGEQEHHIEQLECLDR